MKYKSFWYVEYSYNGGAGSVLLKSKSKALFSIREFKRYTRLKALRDNFCINAFSRLTRCEYYLKKELTIKT